MRFLERDVLHALNSTRSISEASNFLGVTRKTLYHHMKRYNIPVEKYSNKPGVGISKNGNLREKYKLEDILSGIYNGYHFNKSRLKNKLIKELIFPEKCTQCGFDEKRIIDEKVPLVLWFDNNDNTDYNKNNIRLLCYNCAFLNGGISGRSKEIEIFVDPRTQEIMGF